MSDQPALFDTPTRVTSGACNARVEAWMDSIRVPAGWRCPVCGQVESLAHNVWRNHGLMGAGCARPHRLAGHALYALRTGDLALWATATADLRQIASWRVSQRPEPRWACLVCDPGTGFVCPDCQEERP